MNSTGLDEELMWTLAKVTGYAALAIVSTGVTVGACMMGCNKKNPQPKKELQAELIALTFVTTVGVSIAGEPVVSPHWKASREDARPAVFHAGEVDGATARATVRITRSVGQPGRGKLSGAFEDLSFTCDDCPLSEGEHDVDLKITGLPAHIERLRGEARWTLEGDSTCDLGRTRLALYVILAPPGEAFAGGVVWHEALDFLHDRVGFAGAKIATAAKATAQITAYCHEGHKLVYDSANHYTYALKGARFCLQAFLERTDPQANCYDLAGAVLVLSHAVGSPVVYQYANPFGFIHATSLVGVGKCNSPGYLAKKTEPVLALDAPDRTAFTDHAFCLLGGKVYDACVGPHRGEGDVMAYLQKAIDDGKEARTLMKRQDRQDLPGASARPKDVEAGSVKILDRGRAGQVARRALKAELETQDVEAMLLVLTGDFRTLTGKGSTGSDVPTFEQQLEVLLVEAMDQKESLSPKAAVEALDKSNVTAMYLDHLNRTYGKKVSAEELAEVGRSREKEEKKSLSEKEDQAWNKQIEERLLYVNDLRLGSAKDFDEIETKNGRKVYPYDPLTLKRI